MLSNICHNMGVSVADWTKMDQNLATCGISDEDTLNSYNRYQDYSPLTKKVMGSIKIDTTMKEDDILKQYFRFKEGTAQLKITKQFQEKLESIDEISSVLVSFFPQFFCIEVTCSPDDFEIVEEKLKADIEKGWVRLLVLDDLSDDEQDE